MTSSWSRWVVATANNGDASGLQLAELAFVLGSNSQPALTPIQLSTTIENDQLRITWPADHTGWRLEAQTNSINIGLGTNWTTVAGTITSNQFTVPISSADSVFFRLVYP